MLWTSTRHRRRPRTAAVALIAAASLAAGCSSSSPVETAAPTTTAAPAGSTSTVGTAPGTTTGTTTPAPTTSLPPPLPAASAPIKSPGTNKLIVVGDSVILGAKTTVPTELKGWDVTFDAHESRFVNNGLNVFKAHKSDADKLRGLARADLEQAYKDAGMEDRTPKPDPEPTLTDVLGRVAVIHLCTNYQAGGGFDTYIDSYMTYLKDLERVIWVTCVEWSPGQTEANEAIRAAASRYPTIVVADWAKYAITPGYTYDDGIHLRPPGQEELAKLVALAAGPAPTPLPPAPTTTRPKPTSTTTTSTTEPTTEAATDPSSPPPTIESP